jgi:hypothetical protein
VGVLTGRDSNLVVLDVDGEIGEQTLRDLEAKHGEIPETKQVKTGKGRHLWFRYPKDVDKVQNVSNDKTKLDIRGDGGYVVAPPSIHISGAIYEFVRGPFAVSVRPCPPLVVEYSKNHKGTGSTRRQSGDGRPAPLKDEDAKLRSALAIIPSDDLDTWVKFGAALHRYGGSGRAIWDEWSKKSTKFDPATQDKTWRSFGEPYSGTPATIASIYQAAKALGWHWIGDRKDTRESSDELPWPDVDKRGNPKGTCPNTRVALTLMGVKCAYDAFNHKPIVDGEPLTDAVWQTKRVEIHKRFGFEPGRQNTPDALFQLAHTNRFHPVRDYFNQLQWDKKKRLDTWMIDYLGAPRTDFVRAVSAISLLAVVCRVFQPGSSIRSSSSRETKGPVSHRPSNSWPRAMNGSPINPF